MTQQEFDLALEYLQAQFPDMVQRLETPEQIERWYRRFGHLGHDKFCLAVDAYADDNDRRPTVNALWSYIPRQPKGFDWLTPGNLAQDAPPLKAEEVKSLFAGIYEAFEERAKVLEPKRESDEAKAFRETMRTRKRLSQHRS